jgi:DNA-binding MarR family transcriptional regulator
MARPVTLRVTLTAGQRADLHQQLRQQALSPRLRRRLECIHLADLGWPVPQIAAHLGLDQAIIRRAIHRLARGGLDELADLWGARSLPGL